MGRSSRSEGRSPPRGSWPRVSALLRRSEDPGETGAVGEAFPRADRRRILISSLGLTLIALAVRVPIFSQGIASSDTVGAYLPVARAIREGRGFLNDIRPPGFPLILAGFEELGIDPVNGVVGLHNVAGILLPTVLLLIGWRYFSPPVGLLAGLLAAGSPLMALTEQVALPDYLFGLVLLLGTVLLAEAALRLDDSRLPWRLLAGAGAVYGVATMLRPNGQLAFLLIPLALLLGLGDWQRWLRASLVALAVFAAILAPWILHNLVDYREATVSSESGISLYGRVITSERNPPPSDSPDGRLALAVFNTGGPTIAVANALVAEGKTLSGASHAMKALALEAILRDPDEYLLDSGRIANHYLDIYDPHTLTADGSRDQIAVVRNHLGSSGESDRKAGDSSLTRVPWQLAQTLTKLVFLAALGGLAVLFLPFVGARRSRIAAATLLLVAGLGLISQSMLVRFEHRFGVTFAPFAWILLSAAAVLTIQLALAAARDLASRRHAR